MTGPESRSVLGGALRGQRRTVAWATALLMTWQACEALVPVAIGLVIDRAVRTGDERAMVVSVVGLVVLFVVLSTSGRFGSRLALRSERLAAHGLRVDVARVVLDPARLLSRNRHAGETVWTAGADADRVGRLCTAVPLVAAGSAALVVAAVTLLRISLPLGLMVLVAAPLLLAATSWLGAPLTRRSAREQEHAAEAGALASDLVAGLRVLRGFGGQDVAAARYRTASQRSRVATTRAAGSEAAYEGLNLLLTLLFLALVTLVAGRLAVAGRISVGDLVAAVGLAQFLLGPLRMLTFAGTILARARASATRVGELLGTPYDEGRGSVASGGHLRVERPGLALSVGPGELLGVVADEASADALVRQLSGEDGYVGVSLGAGTLADVAPAAARAGLLVSHHHGALFSGSVADNLGAGPRLDEAVAAATVDEVLETLPAGLDSHVGERGRDLSGGQRQRVVLARALAADAPVLVLHDPTTAVDSVTEQAVADGLARLRHGRTTIVVATSPALLDVCDRVVLLGDGGAVEGSHRELLGSSARYRELVLR